MKEKKIEVRNVSPVRQMVPGWGDAAPGECLRVAAAVAVHLVASGAWEEVAAHPRRQAGPKPAERKGKEVTDGAA
jgi:hypothetical protein